MKTLDQIGVSHGTDKSSTFHSYLSILETYFSPWRDRDLQLLEIGVAGGNSLRTWLEYFPEAEVVGLDHNPEYVKHKLGERGSARLADATHAETWEHLKALCYQFDIIIDDGGHFSQQIMAAFNGGWPMLKSGGLYIIEDLHAPYANESDLSAPIWPWLEAKMHEMNECGRSQCGRPEVSDIAFLHLYKSLAIFGKR